MKIELHKKHGIYLILDEIEEEKEFIRPTNINSDKKPKDYKIIIETQIKYYIKEVQNSQGIVLVQKRNVIDFMEIINGYVSKILEEGKVYEFEAELGNTSTLQIKPKTNIQSEALKFELETFDIDYYFKKIDCKIIYSKFMRAYSKCADIGFEIPENEYYESFY